MIKDIQSGFSTLILLENGDLWGCGYNPYGELGVRQTKSNLALRKICENVEKIDTYWGRTFIFKKDKTLWFTGEGSFLNKKSNIITFTKIADNAKDVETWSSLYSPNSIFCLKEDGQLVDLLSGKIFFNDVEKIKVVKNGIDFFFFVFKKDNSLWKLDETVFTKISEDVKNVFSGFETPIFIQKTDDSLWKVEKNDFQKTVKIFDNVEDVKSYIYGSLILRKDGTLFALGENRYEQLGIFQEKTDIPVFITGDVKKIYLDHYSSIILKNDNTLWGSNKDYLNDKTVFLKGSLFKKFSDNVKDFYADRWSLGIIKQNDELWWIEMIGNYFFNSNSKDMNFISKNVDRVFLNFGSYFILRKDNSLLCFGDNFYGQLGINEKEKIVRKPIENNIIKDYYDKIQAINFKKEHFENKSL